MIEKLAIELLRKSLPIQLRSLQHSQRTHHIGTGKSKRILYRTIHMTLCCQMNYTIHLFTTHQSHHSIEIAYICLNKLIVGASLQVLQVGQIACISQFIYIYNIVVRVLVDKQTYRMTTSAPGPTAIDIISFQSH